MYIRILTCGAAELRPGHFARPLSHVITLNSCDNLLTIDIIIMTGFIQVIIAYRYSGMGVTVLSTGWMAARFIVIVSLRAAQKHRPHFTDAETKAYGEEAVCPRSHSEQ